LLPCPFWTLPGFQKKCGVVVVVDHVTQFESCGDVATRGFCGRTAEPPC
jgi:hypothetical protein